MQIREIVLDTETTGLSPYDGHKLIEIGCVELIDRVQTSNFYHTYINPERDISIEAFKVHGLSLEFLKDKPLFKDIFSDMMHFIGQDKIIIHNAEFDLGFINYELKKLNQTPIPFSQVIDTVDIARKKFPRQSASLDSLCNRFNISLKSRSNHGALIDSKLLAEVYLALINQSQSTLKFSKSLENSVNKIKKPVNFPYRQFKLSEAQEILHKQFTEEIPNSLWNVDNSKS